MMVLMFSTAGVPPLVGFWAKLRIFQALWENQPPVAGVIRGRHSVVAPTITWRVIKLMYFDEPAAQLPPTAAAAGVRLALGLNAAAVLLLGCVARTAAEICARG